MTKPVFVFGSNLDGYHGAGAAKFAHAYRGAIMGQGEGYQGNAYAIPTKGHLSKLTHRYPLLSLREIQNHVDTFIEFARTHPELQFELTAIGCGFARNDPKRIAPMFAYAPGNVIMPREFAAVLSPAPTVPVDGNDFPPCAAGAD